MAADGAPPGDLRFESRVPAGPVPVVAEGTPLRDVARALLGERYESAAHVVVVRDGDRLVGLARVEDVLARANDDVTVDAVVDRDPPTIVAGEREELAAWKAVRHGESALAVVDTGGRFVALIPPRRMVEVLLREHDEDLARLSGYLASTTSARHATEEPLLRRLSHRLPWLLLGLAGAVAAAGIVGAFGSQLEAQVLLAFFVPGIVYMADAVGTQTEALIIRGLSVGVPVGSIARREIVTGLVIGGALAAAFWPIGAVLWGDLRVVTSVAISLFAACSTATVVAMTLPWLLSRLHRDPAFGSGPLATVIQDLLSLAIYFAVASLLV